MQSFTLFFVGDMTGSQMAWNSSVKATWELKLIALGKRQAASPSCLGLHIALWQ